MKQIIHETSVNLLQASHDEQFNSISIEQFSKLDNGGHWNTGRISLSIDEVKALYQYAEEKGLL